MRPRDAMRAITGSAPLAGVSVGSLCGRLMGSRAKMQVMEVNSSVETKRADPPLRVLPFRFICNLQTDVLLQTSSRQDVRMESSVL